MAATALANGIAMVNTFYDTVEVRYSRVEWFLEEDKIRAHGACYLK